MKTLLLLASLVFSGALYAVPDVNHGDHMSVLDLIPVSDITTTGNGTGVDLLPYAGQVAIVLDAKNIAGSSPTLAISVEDSANNSSFAAISPAVAFTGLTTSTSVQKIVINKNSVRRYIRVVRTIGGTSSPEYYISVKGFAVKKYLP